MTTIENRTFDEIRIGESASLSRRLTKEDIELFAMMSGDVNPVCVDAEFARDDMFHKLIAHGMWSAALISTALGTELPGAGAIYRSQTLNFRHPVTLGDTVVVTVTVRAPSELHREPPDVAFQVSCPAGRAETSRSELAAWMVVADS